MARCTLEKEGYQTERWIVFSLQFESWLQEIGYMGWYLHYRQKWLRSSYYRGLGERFARDEEDLPQRMILEIA